MRRYYARQETRRSSTAIPRNGMPRARRTSRTGNECHLPMGGSPFMKNYDNRPLFYHREQRRLRRIGLQMHRVSHAGKSKHTEMQFYRPTPSGRRRRLGAPWLPIRTSLRCLPPKRDSICYGAYAPKRYEIRCGVSHQSSAALYAEVLANQGYELCCGV